MEKRFGVCERVAGWVVGVAFIIIGLLLAVLGFTFLPVIGVAAAIPMMKISISFLAPDMPAERPEEQMKFQAHMAEAS